MRQAEGRAAALVRGWVRLYTGGLPAQLALCRRDEVASDLWEQQAASDGNALELVGRCLAGVPADLSWRFEHSASRATTARLLACLASRSEALVQWTVRRGLPGLTVALALLYAGIGLLMVATIGVDNGTAPGERLSGALWCLGCGVAMLAGTRIVSRHPKTGCTLVVLGSLPLALALLNSVVVPVLTLAVLASVLSRARATGQHLS